jgi:cell division protein FtsW
MTKQINTSNKESHTFSSELILLFAVLLLTGIGIVMVYSASSALAMKQFGTDLYFVKKQLLFALIGIFMMFACKYFPYRYYRHLTYPSVVLAFILLVAVQFSGIGYAAGGAQRWLSFGKFSFQPSEFARLVMIIYLAYSMDKKRNRIKEFSIGFLPHMIMMSGFICLIILQPDFGSVVILGAITWLMLFIGGVRIFYLLSTMALLLPIAYFFMISADYRTRRWLSFIDPWQYRADEGYQIVHSLMAFGTGGIWGTGIGKGYQKLFYLPEPHTDFIFSVIGEELGLIGVSAIIVLYAIILWKGICISKNSTDNYGALIAAGLTIAFGLEIFINMGVSLGLMPPKGLPLPFISYGGTSLLLSMISVGILMNIGASKSK